MASNKEKLIAAAQKLVEKGQHDKAIKEYLKVLAEDDKDARIWLKVGDLYVKLQRNKEAAEAYQRVAQSYADQGFYLKAVAVYKQIIKIEPRLVEINLRLAELYKQLGLVSDAMAQYEQVAAFHQREGRPKDALAALKQMVELEPHNVASRIKLAELYSKESMAREAIEEFTRAAESLKEQDRLDDYMKVSERLLFHAPDNRGLARELAKLYIQKGDPRRALPKLQVCFKADPRDVETLELLAAAFESLQQTPKTVSVLKELARIHQENGEQHRRDDAFRRVLRFEPGDAEALAAVGNRRATGPAPRPAPVAQPLYTPPPQMPVATAAAGGARAQQAPRPPSQNPWDSAVVPPTAATDAVARGESYAAPQQAGGPAAIDLAPMDPPTARATPAARAPIASSSAARPVPAAPAQRPVGNLRRGMMTAGPTFLEEQGDEETTTDPDTDEEVAKILSETDVYLKYRLHQKAIEHLQRIFSRFPQHIEAREKLSRVLVDAGRPDEAIAELWTLYERVGPTRRGEKYLREILTIRPGESRALKLLPTAGQLTPPPAMNARAHRAVPTVVEQPAHERPEEPAEELELSDEVLEEVDEDIPLVVDTAESFSAENTNVSSVAAVEDRFGADLDQELEQEHEPVHAAGVAHRARLMALGVPSSDDGAATGASGRPPAAVTSFDGEDHTVYSGGFGDFAAMVPAALEVAAPQPGPPPPSAAAATTGVDDLEDRLEEADLFAQQGHYAEARATLDALLERFPSHPLVLAKRRDLEAVSATRAQPFSGDTKTGSDVVAPPRGFSGDTKTGSNEFPPVGTAPATPSGMNGQTRPGRAAPVANDGPRRNVVERGVNPEDFDTHYDLGIAYKEMGLLDDAIAEFKIVIQDPAREVGCQMMIGLCYMEKGQVAEAINQFKKGLYASGIQEREELALYYEMGQAYERLGDTPEALYYYEKVLKRDPAFRDVDGRIRALQEGKSVSNEIPAVADDFDAAFDGLVERK